MSPVDASASYLAHVRAAWNARFPDAPLERQEVVLTVPASFDEGARALTLEAARRAGLPALRLLEEPQAACYDWLFRHRDSLAAELEDTRLILVCDVGGGTTDFTLIRVATADGAPRLTRIGVGDHLMLGGDNMDLALAHVVEARLGGDAKLSAARFSQLLQRCRAAKETLLAARAPERTAVTLLGAGSRLVGGARSVELARDEVERLIVDGFVPRVAPTERPGRRRAGIVEFGLPYPADPAISRHLAAFLDRHAAASRDALGDEASDAPALPVPDALLLNGGVFRAGALEERLQQVLSAWRGAKPRLLHNDDPDVAVARGAVAYALVRAGQGPRIGGGSPRSYFLVVDDDKASRRGVCVLPRGTEEGREVHLRDRSFALRLGQPVQFHLVSSVGDAAYQAGKLVELAGDDFVRLPPIASVMSSAGEGAVDVPVRIVAAMTEVGTLDMHCVSLADPARRWLLAFDLRGEGAARVAETIAALPARFPDALAAIDRVFGSRSHDIGAKEVRQLRGQVDHLLGKRENWDVPVLRALFDALWERARRRRRSAEHERLWLNLAGYCVRPGLGYPLDDWRVEQLWTLFEPGLQYVRERQNWSEWWTLWRRAAGGLGAAEQLLVLQAAGEQLEADESAARARRPVGTKGSFDDLVRLAAALERVDVAHRIELGEWLLDRLQKSAEKHNGWWALGRLGAREPLYGSAHSVVPADVAALWLDAILALDWKRVEPAAFAAAQIARLTGDRARDLPPAVRDEVARRLEAVGAPPSWSAMVREIVVLEEAEKWRAFGESLPPGLQLLDA